MPKTTFFSQISPQTAPLTPRWVQAKIENDPKRSLGVLSRLQTELLAFEHRIKNIEVDLKAENDVF